MLVQCKACERIRHHLALDGNGYCLTDTDKCRYLAVPVTLRKMGKHELADRWSKS